MLSYAITFLIIAIIAGVFGFIGVASLATEIAKILFFVFLRPVYRLHCGGTPAADLICSKANRLSAIRVRRLIVGGYLYNFTLWCM